MTSGEGGQVELTTWIGVALSSEARRESAAEKLRAAADTAEQARLKLVAASYRHLAALLAAHGTLYPEVAIDPGYAAPRLVVPEPIRSLAGSSAGLCLEG